VLRASSQHSGRAVSTPGRHTQSSSLAQPRSQPTCWQMPLAAPSRVPGLAQDALGRPTSRMLVDFSAQHVHTSAAETRQDTTKRTLECFSALASSCNEPRRASRAKRQPPLWRQRRGNALGWKALVSSAGRDPGKPHPPAQLGLARGQARKSCLQAFATPIQRLWHACWGVVWRLGSGASTRNLRQKAALDNASRPTVKQMTTR
jgi:hypothetical protein